MDDYTTCRYISRYLTKYELRSVAYYSTQFYNYLMLMEIAPGDAERFEIKYKRELLEEFMIQRIQSQLGHLVPIKLPKVFIRGERYIAIRCLDPEF